MAIPAEVAGNIENNNLDRQTCLTAPIDRKGFFGALANRAEPPNSEMRSPTDGVGGAHKLEEHLGGKLDKENTFRSSSIQEPRILPMVAAALNRDRETRARLGLPQAKHNDLRRARAV